MYQLPRLFQLFNFKMSMELKYFELKRILPSIPFPNSLFLSFLIHDSMQRHIEPLRFLAIRGNF
jgi:hypothetical protein